MTYTEPLKLLDDSTSHKTPRYRITIVLLALLVLLGGFCAWQMGKLAPTFDGNVDVYGLMQDPTNYDMTDVDGVATIIVRENLDRTNALNACFSVVFNFRGYDTMGESFILIAALAGSLCILRSTSRKKKVVSAPKEETTEAPIIDNIYENPAVEAPVLPKRRALGVIVRYGANLFLPLACTFGGYVILHGDSSPGGGFQGGVLVASAVLLVFLGYGTQRLSTTFKESFLHSTETVAEIMYIAIGLIGIIVGLDFAMNFVIENLHIETALLMNHAVGYHVMAGVGCLLIMMLGMLTTTDDEESIEEKEEQA